MTAQKREGNPAWIGLGSNIGNGMEQLTGAWQRLGEVAEIQLETISSPWLSSPVAMESENWFTNAVGRLHTSLSPEELLAVLHRTESWFGRKRDGTNKEEESQKKRVYYDRTLDLDILYYGKNGNLVVEKSNIVLPHPRRCERLFVLKPLQEIEPNFFDREKQSSLADIISALEEELARGEKAQQNISKRSWAI